MSEGGDAVLASDNIPENLPEYSEGLLSNPEELNILVMGKHGSLTDTLIFANINSITRKVTFISIPRDLYVNGRKINSYYSLYGMDELKRQIERISGYKIDNYILVDMYMFIDLVDLVGGIDIHLNSAVSDPTYKTLDNGVWGTMYFAAGDHHLNGKQALRLARSRHTSSDFARAERQQEIIKALKNKAINFGFGDINNLTEIIKTVLAKTETDINLQQAITYYLRYNSFEIGTNNVMTSGNILNSTYTAEMGGAAPEEECEEKLNQETGQTEKVCKVNRGAYILLPRGNNWNVIKWYFREKFGG